MGASWYSRMSSLVLDGWEWVVGVYPAVVKPGFAVFESTFMWIVCNSPATLWRNSSALSSKVALWRAFDLISLYVSNVSRNHQSGTRTTQACIPPVSRGISGRS